MRLSVFFIIMDLLTVLVYPPVFIYGKLRKLLKFGPSQLAISLSVSEK